MHDHEECSTVARKSDTLALPAIEAPPEVCQRLWKRARRGLTQLLEAHQYTCDVGCSAWDFAIEIGELQMAGLLSSDFRWLICKGLLEHAREVASAEDDKRRFRTGHRLRFGRNSCFVLTMGGVEFVRSMLERAKQDGRRRRARLHTRKRGDGQGDVRGSRPILAAIPVWDRDRQELRLDEVVVKQFKVPAANQERILAAFEEEGWPIRIDDPLPPVCDQDPKIRLHDTIVSLNRNQKHPLIRFYGDGTGQGVRWGRVVSAKDLRPFRSADVEPRPKAK
jgi:hypothetical protein